MKVIRALLIFSTVLFAWGLAAAASATEPIALSFELEPATPPAAPEPEPVARDGEGTATTALPIPNGAGQPPLANPTSSSPPAGVYGGGEALALGEGAFPDDMAQHLPAPPPLPSGGWLATVLPEPQTLAAGDAMAAGTGTDPQTAAATNPATSGGTVSGLTFEPEAVDDFLTFEPPPTATQFAAQPSGAPPATPLRASGAEAVLPRLFQGGPDSLVARAVGSAEGTRTPAGDRTPAYFGHVDPGNGVWNLGSFSYQHGARSPEEADNRQLQRLQQQTQVLQRKAAALNLQLTAEELINGIDLANQAPAAALDRESYLDWLQQARSLGMEGQDAIVWARTRAFIDPDTQRWNAPGLGNNLYSITRDQERRAQAVAAALEIADPIALDPSDGSPLATNPTPAPTSSAKTAEAAPAQPAQAAVNSEAGIDRALLSQQLSQLPEPSSAARSLLAEERPQPEATTAIVNDWSQRTIASELAALVEPEAERPVFPQLPSTSAEGEERAARPEPLATVPGPDPSDGQQRAPMVPKNSRTPAVPDGASSDASATPTAVEHRPAPQPVGAQPESQVWLPAADDDASTQPILPEQPMTAADMPRG
jgi:hypothetical protein